MASSPLNPKSGSHGRSNSLPSRPHPLILKCNEHLESLRASKETSSSSTLLRHKVEGLQDLIECVEKLTQLPPYSRCPSPRVSRELGKRHGSLRLLDVCTAAKDALLRTKECTRELQSTIRRKRGGEVELTAEVKKFLTSRKVVKKAISKALANLNSTSKSSNISSNTNKDHRTVALISLLQDMEVATLSTFQTLLQFISGSTQSKSNSWLSISKLIQPKRVGCSLVADESEFAQVDAALQSFVFTKTCKFEDINNLQNQLEKMESCIKDFEEGLEFLFRCLIKIRVSLLDILNH
ncbi:hypothetical protein AAZX31_04G011100 [Glycine max]|uniref:Uncharacterized protein n=3 Tax=Glycine subgen. Soja TaxID=1462606 RepID=I1JSM7_SOYBN|nr:hypothetical protein JHK85_008987 [Glycine max]KHN33745.1 hypothetical protein glysoja_013751 [Glycine soja]KAG5065014.1 hypothetical protein JHK86_008745 [Glycine max]KAH1109240.1 hypothetical protein GYH30_008584 [Glycine max]KRH60823.1 hypothetical protein GLYMA_04G011800v4 [Glycine max]